jgi:chromosomal replication initiation ATPase DnaA
MRGWNVGKRTELHRALAPLRLPQLESEIEQVSREFEVDVSEVTGGSRRREVCRARAANAHLAFHVHRLPAAEVALRLGVTHVAVLRGAKRGW